MIEKGDAFDVAVHIAKSSKLIHTLGEDKTPEGIGRYENIQELLNGVKDFSEEQKQIEGGNPSLANYLQDIALLTDSDKKDDGEPKVTLMTIHLAKGLEYPYVYVVGMEESLFPSAMSMNTRSELEEERRLFYVALTRAEHQAYLSFAHTRYRWGKLIDCEPSRFLEEIDSRFLEYISPQRLQARPNQFVDSSLFEDDVPKDKIRYRKPISRGSGGIRAEKARAELGKRKVLVPQNFKRVTTPNSENTPSATPSISMGDIVEHLRFGKGKVLQLDGVGGDAKAEIQFETQGVKKLILKFAKLKVLDS